ncbi:MAG: TonB-dependent receptor plug domain-containing protein [Chlorobi bacterium]|nr:TonB-dependent receptor plug domain-containing protein [Chlorobiota bacterium]
MRKFLHILFFTAILFGACYGQHSVTAIDSITNKPIADAEITAGEKRLFTNAEGTATFIDSRQIDSVTVSHISYQTKTVSLEEKAKNQIIKLIRKNIITEEIKISGNKPLNEKVKSIEFIEVNETEKAESFSAGDIIKKRTTLFVKDYGGDAGLKTVSSRGMTSENTVVLFNEARVNDLRTGTFDFSAVDASIIDGISYDKSGNDDFISSGGTLKLSSGNDLNENVSSFGATLNSNRTEKYFANVKRAGENYSFSISANRAYSPNEYDFTFEDKSMKRQNVFFSKSFVGGNLKLKWDGFVVKFYSHYSHLLNGLPGFVVTNNYSSSKASTLSNSWLSIASINYKISNELFFQSVLSFNNQNLKLMDPAEELLLNRKEQSSEFNDFSALSKLSWRRGNAAAEFSYYFNYGEVDSLTAAISGEYQSGFSKRNERTLIGTFSYRFENILAAKRIIISGAANYQMIYETIVLPEDNDDFSYSGSILYSPSKVLSDFDFILSYKKSYRRPTFNERYYSALFSSGKLKGERYVSFDATVKTDLFANGNIEFTYFNISGNDKIIWVPTRLALQIPHNVAKVKSEGIEFLLSQSFFNDLIKADFIYIFTDAKNVSAISDEDASYNKQLIYTPKRRWNLNLSGTYSRFTLSAFASYVGKRYFTPDNTERNSLDEYFLLDLSLSYKFKLFNPEILITLNGYNVLNEDYFVIQSYPMPKTTYSINIQMRFK